MAFSDYLAENKARIAANADKPAKTLPTPVIMNAHGVSIVTNRSQTIVKGK